jgi:hypothetical protein
MLPFFRIAIVPDRCYRETQFSPWTRGERQEHSPDQRGSEAIDQKTTVRVSSLRLLPSSVFQRFSDVGFSSVTISAILAISGNHF